MTIGPLAAQEEAAAPEAPTPSEIFVDTVDVQVVNVEVFVTDKKGNPVTGLTIDDFEILENKRPYEITNFYAIEDGRPVSGPGADVALEDLPVRAEGGPPGIEKIALPEDQRLHLVIYVDNFNIRPQHRNRVLRRLRRFVHEQIQDEDRVMVVSYDRSLHVRQPFTGDRLRIGKALNELEGLTGAQVSRDADRRIALEEIERVDNEFDALSEAQAYAESVALDTRFSLQGLKTTVEMLSGLPGRKAIVYISDGIPRIPGEDVFIAVSERFIRSRARAEASSYDLLTTYNEIGNLANSSAVTFYALDAGGMSAHESINASEGGTVQGGGRAYIDGIRQANLGDPLFRLADDTGGLAFVNTNAVEMALTRMQQDFRTLYSLGYQPGHIGDGRYHKIEVRVKGRKGLVVRHRSGYRDKTVEARIAEGSLASLHFGSGENSIGAALEFGRTTRLEDGNLRLPISVKLPIGNLALVPVGEFSRSRVRVSVTVMDAKGGVSPVRQQPVHDIQIPAADLPAALSKHYVYGMELVLRPGRHTVSVAVRDEFGAETSFVAGSLSIGG